MSTLQTQTNKIAEIRFRKSLAQFQKGKTQKIAGVPDQKDIIKILKERNRLSKKIFSELKKSGFLMSPFLEIGAERAQRAAVLAETSQGFALDISLESLQSADYFKKPLNLKKMPVRICADAYNLPFKDNSIPFIFCFETLHHFPDPKPILAECYRVLRSDGVFYFSEEPVKQLFNLNLWRRDFNLTPFEKFLKAIYLLPFLSTIGNAEVKEGILENSFWLDIWEEALNVFDRSEVKLEPIFFGPSQILRNQHLTPNPLVKFLLALQGGGITASCYKKPAQDIKKDNILDLLACPNCHSSLKQQEKSFFCKKCQISYPIKNKVALLLTPKLQKELYGEG